MKAATVIRSRIAWLAAAGLVAGICVGTFGPAPERVSAELTLIKPALAGDPGSVAPRPAVADGDVAMDGHAASWRVVAAAGSPVYRQLEQSLTGWQAVAVGLTVETYAEFDTGTGGRLELFNGSDRVTLAPNTTVALPPATVDAPDVTILQSSGQADYKVRSRRQPPDGLMARIGQLFLTGAGPNGRFEVYTPYLVAAVKGTAFGVTVDNERASVSVTEGVVSVSDVTDGRTVEVGRGKMATAEGSTAGLIVNASPGNVRTRNGNDTGDSQGDNSRGDNSQGDDGQGDNGHGGNDNSQ